MMQFFVDFENPSLDTYTLEFAARNTPHGRRWYQCLTDHVQKNNKCYEPSRLYNFPKDPWDEHALVKELNRCIEIVNAYQPVIQQYAEVGMSQEHFNDLHHYFELLRGEFSVGTDFYNQAPVSVQNALNDYNVCIHRTESFYMGQKYQSRAPRVVCTLNNIERQPLHPEDYDYFVTKLPAGTVFVNYCQVGKPILDVFRDGDEVIFDETIRPLRYLSPDFAFYLADTEEEIDGLTEWMISNGFDPLDKTNAIGVLPVADVIWNDSREETIDKISQRQRIGNINVQL
jgi:hypothetical protein